MANTIALAKKYAPLLDEVFKTASVSGVLDSPAEMAREGVNVNEICIPKLDMNGLANYSRNSGYVDGDVSLSWQTVPFNYERGRMFTVDNMDNEESQNIAFGRLAGEFIRTKAAPELDAFRFASYASATGIGKATGNLATGIEVIAAIRDAVSAMDEAEVPANERYLFITPTLRGLAEDMDTYKSKAVFATFSGIITVPQTRFYSKIKLNSGSAGETAGGYVKDGTNGKNLNFLIVHKSAVIQFIKHTAPKIISPDVNQTADAWKYGYRIYGLTDVYDNKTAGIYAHIATT